MLLQPIVYTRRMEDAAAWWSAVLDLPPAYQSEMWTTFPVGGATLALHHVVEVSEASRLALSLVSVDPLEVVVERLADRGIEPDAPIAVQPFGRQVGYRDPDGNLIQVNEHGS